MPSMYTEADYENSVIELFQNMGYDYVYGPDVERDYKSPLYDDILTDSLYRLNPSLPDAAIEDALYKLKNFENGTLVQQNTVFMDYLQNGIEVSFHHKGQVRSDIVYIADYKNVDFMIKFVSKDKGKILPKRVTGCCAEHQRLIAREVKKARFMALLPFVK